MLNQVAIIVNKYAGPISQVVANPCARIDGCFDKEGFELNCAPIFKFQYLDAVIVDASAVSYNLAEAVRWLKVSLNKSVRIIVFAPNMQNNAIKTQLYVYGVYDVVRPNFDEETMDDAEITSTLINELKWALQNPVSFAKIADELAVSINTTIVQGETSSNENKKGGKKKESPLKVKPRILGFYGVSDDNLKLATLNTKYTLAGLYEADENKLENVDFNNCELIVCDNASVDFVAYVKSLVDVNKSRANIIAAFSDSEIAEQCKGLKGVNVFVYKKENEFIRQISINAVKKAEESSGRDCQIVAVYGVKGGCGSTTMTAALAKEYKKTHPGRKVLALDFTTKAGDLGSKFGIDTPENNIFGCVASFLKARAEHMDIEILKNKVLNYCNYDEKSKVYVIPTGFTDIYSFTNYAYSASDVSYIYNFVLKKLSNYFDIIFIDTGKYSGITSEIALESASKLVLVSDCTLASVSQLQIKVDELKQRKYINPVAVAFNKSKTRTVTSQFDNLHTFTGNYGNKNVYELPFDKSLFKESDEMGTKYSSKYAKALRKLFAIK